MTEPALAFIARWSGVAASELSTAQSFVADLCELLGLAKPHPTPAQNCMFEGLADHEQRMHPADTRHVDHDVVGRRSADARLLRLERYLLCLTGSGHQNQFRHVNKFGRRLAIAVGRCADLHVGRILQAGAGCTRKLQVGAKSVAHQYGRSTASSVPWLAEVLDGKRNEVDE